jgi:hypothetical protein
MSKADTYHAHARHCMAMAAQTQHAADKRQWLLLADTWLDMIPGNANERQGIISTPQYIIKEQTKRPPTSAR